MQRLAGDTAAIWAASFGLAAVGFVACGGAGDGSSARTLPAETASSAGSEGTVASSTARPTEDLEMTGADFVNINAMTKVRGFFIDNRLGHLDDALVVARSEDGGVYPVGTIIQLVPQEAMVKRRKGWSPATKDWEFFFLEVSAEGTTIVTRGAVDTVNRFGGNCAACHALADPQFDFVCEDDHGCEPLPVGDDVIAAIQAADPRPLP